MHYSGQTALHKVVLEEGSDDALDELAALLLNGVAVDVLNRDGETALHCLARLPAKKGVSTSHLL